MDKVLAASDLPNEEIREEREDAAKQLAMLEKLSVLKKRQSQGYEDIQDILGQFEHAAQGVQNLTVEQDVFAAKLGGKTKEELVEEARKLDEEERKFAVEKEKFEWEEVLFIARECVLKRLKIDNLQTKNWEVSLLTLENPTELLKKNKLVWENILEFIVNQEKSNKADLKKMIALVVYSTNHEEMNVLLQILEKKISQIFPTTSESQPALPNFGKKQIFSPREEIYCSALEAAATCDNLVVFEKYLTKIPMLSPGLLTTLWKRVVINDSLGVAEYLLTHYKEASETLCLLDNPKAKFAVVEKIVEAIPAQLTKINSSMTNTILVDALDQKNSAFVYWILYSTHPQVEAQRKTLLTHLKELKSLSEIAKELDPQSFYMVIASYQKFKLAENSELQNAFDLYASSHNRDDVEVVFQTALRFINDSDPIVFSWVINSFEGIREKINLLMELRKFIRDEPISDVKEVFDFALSLASTIPRILSLVKKAAEKEYANAIIMGDMEMARSILIKLSQNKFWKASIEATEIVEVLMPKILYFGSLAEAEEDYHKAIQENNFGLAQSIILKFSETTFWKKSIKHLTESDEEMEIILLKLSFQMDEANSQEK